MILQAETQFGTFGQPDGQSLTHFLREHEKLHFLTYLSMVSLLCLFNHHQVLIKHFFLGERNAIKTLHLLTIGISTPKGTCHTCQFHSLDCTRIEQMRTLTQICKRTLCIGGNRSIFQILFYVFALVGLTCRSKLFQCVSLCHFLAHHRLFLASQFLHFCFYLWKISFLDTLSIRKQHIIEEAVLNGRTKAELDSRIQLLQCFCQQMRRSVPERMLSLLIFPLVQSYGRILIDRSV